MKEFGGFIGDMFRNFPKFTIIVIIGALYAIWRSTGGIERGEARRSAGDKNLFIEVKGVPGAFEEEELFGVIPTEEVENDDSQ